MLTSKLPLHLDNRTRRRLGKIHTFDELVFRYFLRPTLDHDDALGRNTDDEIHIGFITVFFRRKCNKFTVFSNNTQADRRHVEIFVSRKSHNRHNRFTLVSTRE